jgi:hypothetical protein
MLYISLAISLAFLVFILVMVNAIERPLSTLTIVGGGVVLAVFAIYLLVAFPLAAIQTFAVAIVAVSCRRLGVRFRNTLILSLAVTILAYGIPGLFAYRAVADLCQKYPYESMEARLPTPKPDWAADQLPPVTEEHLRSWESKADDHGWWRSRSIERLHEDLVGEFSNRMGFGPSRSIRISELSLEARRVEDLDHLPQPGARSAVGPATYYLDPTANTNIDAKNSALFESHWESVLEFVNPQWFGFVKDRGHVAGFRAHRFLQSPKPVTHWQLQTLDLVGIVMHDEPVVYVSDNLPNMDELREAATRSPDPFESKGLRVLRDGEDLFVHETADTLRAVGALRSARQCVECHGGKRGDLLGAFSYTFSRGKE